LKTCPRYFTSWSIVRPAVSATVHDLSPQRKI
jgi:hypothetical protein